MSDFIPPPTLTTRCPVHPAFTLLYAGSFDGEWFYECPHALCHVFLFKTIEPSPEPPTENTPP